MYSWGLLLMPAMCNVYPEIEATVAYARTLAPDEVHQVLEENK